MLARVIGSEYQHGAERDPAGREHRDRPASHDHPERLASALGNQAFGALIARAGAGILPDGTVHPDIQATIARARGGGVTLDSDLRNRFAPQLGDPLSDVRVHVDARADDLAGSVSARAFTTGSDMFFARGEYRPGSSDGDRLIAHELTHVVQQRDAPTSGAMSVSDPGDASELEAESVARDLTG
jgi:Domain of unknown function (DUF4157)